MGSASSLGVGNVVRRAGKFRALIGRRLSAFAFASILASLPCLGVAQDNQKGALAPSDVPRERRLLVLRADEATRTKTEARVDVALGRTLAELGYLVNVSPLPFREAQLALGCPGQLQSCGGRLAGALESEQLAVSRLEEPVGTDTTAGLTLYYFANGVARQSTATLPTDSPAALAQAVRDLARRVYGQEAQPERPTPRPVASRPAEEPEPDAPKMFPTRLKPTDLQEVEVPLEAPRRNRKLIAAGWSASAVGGALLVGAFATSIAANRSGDIYAAREIQTPSDADEALSDYAQAERQARAARVLFGTSGGLLLSGAAMLLWERYVWRDEDRKLHVTPMPALGGVALSLGGRFGGRLR